MLSQTEDKGELVRTELAKAQRSRLVVCVITQVVKALTFVSWVLDSVKYDPERVGEIVPATPSGGAVVWRHDMSEQTSIRIALEQAGGHQ